MPRRDCDAKGLLDLATLTAQHVIAEAGFCEESPPGGDAKATPPAKGPLKESTPSAMHISVKRVSEKGTRILSRKG